MIDYDALELAAFNRFSNADDILGSDMTQEVRDHLLDEVKKVIDARDAAVVKQFADSRAKVLADREMLNNIDLL